jgi:hypothetical protein
MPRDKDRCDWVGAPYENKDDRNFYFAMNKGTRRFALGDTIEINIKESGVPTVGELESLYEDMEGLKWMVCRWYYTWQDIYNEVKDTPLRSQITPENLDPKKYPELFVTDSQKTLPVRHIKGKCWVLPAKEYDTHVRLADQSQYKGRPVYPCKERYNTRKQQITRPTFKNLDDEVLANRFWAVAYLVACRHENVNLRHPKKASTPLHNAAQHGYCDIMRFLIHYGANVNLKDAEGFTPMHWAADEGYEATNSIEPVQILQEAGGDIAAIDKHGKTPLDYAGKEVEQYLRVKLVEQRKQIKDAGASADDDDDYDDKLEDAAHYDKVLKEAKLRMAKESPFEVKPQSSVKSFQKITTSRPTAKSAVDLAGPAVAKVPDLMELLDAKPAKKVVVAKAARFIAPNTQPKVLQTTTAPSSVSPHSHSETAQTKPLTTFNKPVLKTVAPSQIISPKSSAPVLPSKAPNSLRSTPSYAKQKDEFLLSHSKSSSITKTASKLDLDRIVDEEDGVVNDSQLRMDFAEAVASGLLTEVICNCKCAGNCHRSNRCTPSDRCGHENCKYAEIYERTKKSRRRDTDWLLDRVWEIKNSALSYAYAHNNTLTFQGANTIIAYHGTWMKNVLSIIKEGFRLPDSFYNQSGNGPLYFGKLIYFAKEPSNALYYTSQQATLIEAEITVGTYLTTNERLMRLTPEHLKNSGFQSVFSETVSKRGHIWGVSDPHQILPRYVLKFRKIRRYDLDDCLDQLKQLRRRDFDELQDLGKTGILHRNDDFACIWDKRPQFTVHCLVIPRKVVHVPPFTRDHIPLLQRLIDYIFFLIQKYAYKL